MLLPQAGLLILSITFWGARALFYPSTTFNVPLFAVHEAKFSCGTRDVLLLASLVLNLLYLARIFAIGITL